jgi:hypothetical protein
VPRYKRQKYDARDQLIKLGFTYDEADSLLRAANRLHRWHELECGTDQGAVARDDDTGELNWYVNDGKRSRWVKYEGPDYETLALRRIKKIMAAHPHLGYYVQGDPRGCALYILRPGDVPEGQSADSCYSRGIAVYKE